MKYAARSISIRWDIRDYQALRKAMEGVEIVFHEAAIPSVPRSINEPVPSHEVNINGTFNVLQAAKAAGVRRVIYAASSSAYGDTEELPKVETMTPRPEVSLRGAEDCFQGSTTCRSGRHVLRAGDGEPSLLQRVRATAGPLKPVFRRAVVVYDGNP